MNIVEVIDQPTLLIDAEITRRNIRRMAERSRKQGVAFRPHFKTHQSAQIGEWFREEGVEKITVSSVEMAEYFADNNWKDILIAFSANPRQAQRIDALAGRIRLGVLLENTEALQALAASANSSMDVWIKIDVGNHRTGLDWQDLPGITSLCELVQQNPRMRLTGLLTHSGHTYHAGGREDVISTFREGVTRLTVVRDGLQAKGFSGLQISTGDTPGCSLCDDWSGIDEIRPGNFVFYDAQQALAGSCSMDDVSMALACPVVAKHPERGEVVIYGGAIHLSKDSAHLDGKISYGLPALQNGDRWGVPIPGGRVDRLSQEHGIVQLPADVLKKVNVGDLLFVLPAHSCLTVQVMGEYFTLQGEKISTLNRF